MRRAVLLAGASMWLSSSAEALTPVAQDRHVFGKRDFMSLSFEFHDSETVSAPDYGPFTASTDGATSFQFPTIAAQTSSIDPERLQASGNTLANPNQAASAIYDIQSESIYSVQFVLDEERRFTLSGRLDLLTANSDVDDCASAAGHITLSGPGGLVAEVADSQPPPGFPPPCHTSCQSSLPLAASGLLAAGTYTLEARSQTYAEGTFLPHLKCNSESTGSYRADLVLTPRVPALPGAAPLALAAALALAARRFARASRS